MDLEKNKMVLECSAPQIKLDFDYEIHGKILLLPIYGKGPGRIILGKILSILYKEKKKHFFPNWNSIFSNLKVSTNIEK